MECWGVRPAWYYFYMSGPGIARKEFLIPAAILLAGMILAIAVYIDRTSHQIGIFKGDPTIVRAVTPDDHLIGSPDAPVKVVEYADIGSRYSKQFQATMEEIMAEYLAGGKVVWVYRHFPASGDDINAQTHAEAAECAASLGGPDAFFRFIDNIQAQSQGSDQFSPSEYAPIIAQLGIPQADFVACLSSGKFAKRVIDDTKNAIDAGATGAPYTVILVKGAKPIPISGAIPYLGMKKVIDQAIANVQ